ncbi:hypothetical protein FEM48_Zijuj08G0004200 [Ziziphus jujuba var. spinosa]|uniref:Uncharacterized protein n=1 Tax=Ziziphus jujuba var. spinosa TaxID=714518 RepID=A0A978UVX4_ZIZJJ|nr:cytochrome P450 71D10-like [Ziziphus jujuba var. spinosa]KAH7519140.1 hypothetical protein FEM48_Zijuj08G0004200 [Ziziphus jujuba var. spinosa]
MDMEYLSKPNAWAIGRDPRHWTDPESFVPEWFIDSSVDFKGQILSISIWCWKEYSPWNVVCSYNIELPLALLLYHFDWKLPNGMKHEDLDMTESFDITVRSKDDPQVIPIAYLNPESV